MFLRLFSGRARSGTRVLALASLLALGVLTVGASSAAAQTLSVTSATSSFPAGGDPAVTLNLSFGSSATSAKLTLAAGFVTNLGATGDCLAATSDIAACEIGTATPSGGSATPVYVTKATGAAPDFAGIDIGTSSFHAEVSLNSAGQEVLTFASLPSGTTGVALTLDGTVNATAFTRMPTDCGTILPSSLSVNGGTAVNASPDVVPTGCAALPYTPKLAASATKDTSDDGVKVETATSQPAGQASDKSVTLTVPSGTLSPNLVAAVGDFGKTVGAAVVTSTLAPVAIDGVATLTGSVEAPTLTLSFPSIGLSLVGTISIANNSVMFGNIPDLPLTGLTVVLNGGANALYETSCSPPTGTVMAAFTGQTGASATSDAPVTVAGCAVAATPGPPTVSGGSLSGLKTGSGKLSFTLAAGKNAPKLVSFTVGLPSGLSFNSKTLAKDVSVSGGKVKSVKLSGGKLVVTLTSAASQLKVTAKSLKVSSALQKKVKDKKVKSLTVKISAKDSSGKSTALSLTVKKLS